MSKRLGDGVWLGDAQVFENTTGSRRHLRLLRIQKLRERGKKGKETEILNKTFRVVKTKFRQKQENQENRRFECLLRSIQIVDSLATPTFRQSQS